MNETALGNNIEESDAYHPCEKNNANSEYFKQLCLQVLRDVDVISKVVEVLYKSEGLEDFVSLVTQLSNGTLSPKNIAFLLLLDRVHLNSCATTTAMRFRPDTHQFWEVVFCICHGKGLHLFSGSKNQGSLQNKSTTRGHFGPMEGNMNFTAPDEKSLNRKQKEIPSQIWCRIIEEAFKLLDPLKEYVISTRW